MPPRSPSADDPRDRAGGAERERAAAEGQRLVNEQRRERAEAVREFAEHRRDDMEALRHLAERARADAEAARGDAEAARREADRLRARFDEQLAIMREMQDSLRALEARLGPGPRAR